MSQQGTIYLDDQGNPMTPNKATGGSFDTPLSPQEEATFQAWKAKYAPKDSGADYDLRGAFKAGLTPDPQTGHWPDTFKKPNHPTFSVESKYATGENAAKAGKWIGPNHDQFVPPKSTAQFPVYLDDNGNPVTPKAPIRDPRAVAAQNDPKTAAILKAQALRYPTGTASEPLPESKSDQNMRELMMGVQNPVALADRVAGGLSSITNTLFPAGDTPRPSSTPTLNPQQEIGSKMATVAALSPMPEAVANFIKSKLPSTAKVLAGEKFQTVSKAAGDLPIDTTAAKAAIARAQELRERGSVMPKVMNDFAKTTAPIDLGGVAVNPSVTYDAGRDFATNAGRLSVRESTAMNPQMQKQVATFAGALKDANREAAVKVGMGDLYDSAIKEYRQAKTIESTIEVLKKYATKAMVIAALGGTTYAIGKELGKLP